jgi:hypothetical protein
MRLAIPTKGVGPVILSAPCRGLISNLISFGRITFGGPERSIHATFFA